jgi:uncharacterized repeat protein (TIGR02543 family)
MNTRLRYNLIIVLLAVLMLALLCACETLPAECVVTYAVFDGGSIQGEATQTVLYGENTTKVTAVADTGYIFVKWSDGVIDAARTDMNVQHDITVTAEFAQEKFTVSYTAGENGHIEGETEQTIIYGGSATAVTAIPDENYRFVRWSDYITEATRSDNNIKRDIKVTALFEKLERTFTYNYNNETDFYAEQNNTVKSVTLNNLTMANTQLIIPIREHFTFDGWFLDKDFTTRVSNEKGETVIDEQIFYADSTNFYAKWNNITTPPVYKILMVYVTEIHATLMSNKNPQHVDIPIQVNYVMNDIERQFCKQLTEKFEQRLNGSFNQLVIFDVDEYFTTYAVTNDSSSHNNIQKLRDSNGNRFYTVSAVDLPEVKHLLADYRSVLTTFCLNDYKQLLLYSDGIAGAKYGSVYLESSLRGVVNANLSLENVLETGKYYTYDFWETCVIETYVHEFIHTVELQVEADNNLSIGLPFHDIIRMDQNDDEYALNTSYLLNLIELGGERVGIPYEFWENGN